jgi:hypothetical protein
MYRAIVLIAACAAFAGCGEDELRPADLDGPLAEALEDLGGGGEGTLGVSWASPELVRSAGADAGLIAEALGPNASSVVDAAAGLRSRFALDPLAAGDLVSVGGSYSFGLRIDGVDGRGLASALVADGGRRHDVGEYAEIATGEYAVVPDPLLDLGVHGLGAFAALGPRVAALAMSDRALAALLGQSERLLDEPLYRAAVACLGDVVAARMVPDKLLVSTELGVELVAVGVAADHEVLCTVGGSAERAAAVQEALRSGFAPDAGDPITGGRVGRSVAEAEVARGEYEGVQAVRAELTLQPAEAPGYLFGALARASVVGWINGADQTFE